ncbi:MAG: cysteine--tRNA ligase [Alphaproteobacteria bacterium]|nr:cysteine--tRNA ligase [Alphaproteobacteria bacterium]
MALTLYNTLAREKQVFKPIDAKNVRMYVCGPTVYDFAHIGNARPVIVFDVLFRLLRHIYGESHVTYVRNITDVEDKIIARAAERGVSIRDLTEGTAKVYQEDALALGNLPPTLEPRVTDSMPEIIAMIAKLVANKHAYVAEGHVLFDVSSDPDYGKLSRRALDEMIAGARVEVAPYKKNPMDFVLWKPSEGDMPGWDSPWGKGRPGWHIECSAMGEKHLGETFDIHGGGIDLQFPHHENEIAQSEGAHHGKPIANYWMHNGFLQVEGEKMSKSLGNFITIRELLAEKVFGGQVWHGRVLRLAMLGTHYRQPIDWTVDRLAQTKATIMEWARMLHGELSADAPDDEVMSALSDDLNSPAALAAIYGLASAARANTGDRRRLKRTLSFLGLYADERDTDFAVGHELDAAKIEGLIAARNAARRAKNFAEADRLRGEISTLGVAIEDGPGGTTWKVVS